MDFHTQEHTGALGRAPHNLAAHRTIYTENTHDGTTPYTTSHPAFTTTVARRHPCAQYPTEPISHSPRPNRSFSPGHYPDHCRRARLEHIHAALITHHTTTPTNLLPETHPVPSVLSRPLSLSPVPVPADGALGIGACGPGRGRARASLWGGLPRRPPPRRVVPDEAAALRSRAGPAPRLRQPPK